MSETIVTPSDAPGRRVYRQANTGPFRVRYADVQIRRERVCIPQPAPADVQVSVELGTEENGVWAHIDEFDVSAEGSDINEALLNVVAAARDWLSYVSEEHPNLAPEIAEQERYVRLLEAPVYSWFKAFRFSD